MRRQFAAELRNMRARIVVLRTVAEHEADVGQALLRLRVRNIEQLPLDCTEVHRSLDQLVIIRCLKHGENPDKVHVPIQPLDKNG